MKNKNLLSNTLKILTLITVFSLIACDNSSTLTSPEFQDASLQKRTTPSTQSLSISPLAATETYIQTASQDFKYMKNKKEYAGGTVGHPTGSYLFVQNGALTPPSNWGENVSITMTVEKDPITSELIHTFGPSGCQFEPAATLYLCWKDLGDAIPQLFYIDNNGEYVLQDAEEIDTTNKTLKISIHHFSRYAVAYGR